MKLSIGISGERSWESTSHRAINISFTIIFIRLFQIDFWRSPSYLFQAVDIEVSEKDFSTLSSILEDHGIDFEVQINDVQKLIEEELETVGGRSGEWHDRYHNLEEVRMLKKY